MSCRPPVTRRQSQLLHRLVVGGGFRAIAADLGIAEVTLEKRIRVLRRRLGARDTRHACALAVARGLVDPAIVLAAAHG